MLGILVYIYIYIYSYYIESERLARKRYKKTQTGVGGADERDGKLVTLNYGTKVV